MDSDRGNHGPPRHAPSAWPSWWCRPGAIAGLGAALVGLYLLGDASDVLHATSAAAVAYAVLACYLTAALRHGRQRAWRILVGSGVLTILVLLALSPGKSLGEVIDEISLDGTGILSMSCVPLLLCGLIVYPTESLDRREILETVGTPRDGETPQDRYWWVPTILDSLLIAGSVLLSAWALLEEDFKQARQIAPDALPVLSFIFIGLVTLMTGLGLIATFRRSRDGGAALVLLGLGLAAAAFTAAMYLFPSLGGRAADEKIAGLGVMINGLCIGWAALVRSGPRRASTMIPSRCRWLTRWRHFLLPYLPVLGAGLLVLAEGLGSGGADRLERYGAVALLILLVLRQMVTILENMSLLGRLGTSQEQMRFLAEHDPLTGLANRLLFEDRLRSALAERNRRPITIGLLFCDLDDFKTVNDDRGHAVGDALLRVVAHRLDGCVRSADSIVARLGGDEFAVLAVIGAEGSWDPEAVRRRIADRLAEPCLLAGTQHRVRASIGAVTLAPQEPSPEPDEILRRADVAMYTAKRRKRTTPGAAR